MGSSDANSFPARALKVSILMPFRAEGDRGAFVQLRQNLQSVIDSFLETHPDEELVQVNVVETTISGQELTDGETRAAS